MFSKLSKLTSVTKFYEPDLEDQLTSICLYASPEVRKKLSHLPLLGKKPKLTYAQVINDMANTEQTKGQSVLDHGISVNKYYNELLTILVDSKENTQWKLPTWLTDNKDFILDNLHNADIINEYHIMHDCGKPYCLKIDSDGKRHFTDHAQVSHDTYRLISDNKIVADLILKDMIFHTIKSEDVEKFILENDTKTIVNLLVTALCELHSNAAMFGGIESNSFKIKYKQLDRRGKQVLNILKGKKDNIKK